MRRKFHFFLFFLLFSCSFCLTNTFADENGDPAEIIIPDEGLEFPVRKGLPDIPGLPDAQIIPEFIISSPDFEKMRDLPTNSQDYQLGRKVGWFIIPSRNIPGRYKSCTGFLVGPDLFMTNHHCIHDTAGLLPIAGNRIYMDYYRDIGDDATRGSITARVSEIVKMDDVKDYALLRLDRPIGNTYGWLELDTTTDPDDSSQSVKIIQHPQARSKEIVRRNSQISGLTPTSRATFPYILAYRADTEPGSSGSPVFLRDGTGVIAIHFAGLRNSQTGDPLANIGSLMSHIVPEIRQWLPGNTTPPSPALAFTPPTIANQTFTVNTLILPLQLPVATGGTSPYTYTLSPIPNGINFNAATRSLTGTPTTVGTTNAIYTVTDATSASATLNFTITVTDPPPAPITFNPSTVANQTFTIGTPASLALPIATGGTAPYTYTLSPIPAGFSFNPATRLLSGTPTTAAPATPITYTVRDAAGGSAALTFTITVAAPVTFRPSTIAGQTFTVGTQIQPLRLPVAQGGTPPYTYTLDPIPAGFSFNPATRLLSGTPTTAAPATPITYTVRDAAGGNAALTFTITVAAPITFRPTEVANQTFTIGTPASLALPIATGGTAPYTYTLDPIPAGLSFDAAIQVLSGTPTTLSTTTVTYTATDAASASVSLTFTVTVTANLDVNADGGVTVVDLAIVALFYGTQVPADVSLPADVNVDGVVNLLDMTAVAQGIDAVSSDEIPALIEVKAELLAAAAQAAELQAAAGGPMGAGTTRKPVLSGGIGTRNVATALADVRRFEGTNARFRKHFAVLEAFLEMFSEMAGVPDQTGLLPNYPNPFNPETWIPYQLAKDAEVTLTIYDIRGVPVRQLVLGHQSVGVYKSRGRAAYWDGRNQLGEKVASGLYFYIFTAGDFTATRKMLIRK